MVIVDMIVLASINFALSRPVIYNITESRQDLQRFQKIHFVVYFVVFVNGVCDSQSARPKKSNHNHRDQSRGIGRQAC